MKTLTLALLLFATTTPDAIASQTVGGSFAVTGRVPEIVRITENADNTLHVMANYDYTVSGMTCVENPNPQALVDATCTPNSQVVAFIAE